MNKTLEAVVGLERTPDQEIFKIGPEVVKDFIAKVIVLMGGAPSDIKNIEVGQDKKRLRILAMLDKESSVFCGQEPDAGGGLLLMGGQAKNDDDFELTRQAKTTLCDLGYSYEDDDERVTYMVSVTEYKKGVEIEFNTEVTLAIITDSDFSDEFFTVDAVEEVVRKKKHNSYKFKDKKKTLIFARVQRSFRGDAQGFEPGQVTNWKTGTADDEDDDE